MKGLITVLAVLVVVGLAFFLYRTPTAPPEMTEAEIAEIEADVLQSAEAWNDAWRDMNSDCEDATELLHPEHYVYFTGGERAGREAWYEYCSRVAANRASYSGEWTGTDVRVLSSDAAVFVGTYEYTMSYSDGTPTRHYPNAAQHILFERTETGWGITSFTNFNGPSEVVEEG